MLQVISHAIGRAGHRRRRAAWARAQSVSEPPLGFVMGATALGVLVGALLAPAPAAADGAATPAAAPAAP